MQSKKAIKVYIYIGIGFALIPLALFTCFLNVSFPQNLSELSNFATYFSGITLPVISILNLIVLIRLTLSVSDYDNERMIKQLRYEAYKDLAGKLNSMTIENFTIEKIDSIYYYFENYSLNNFFLLENEHHKIQTKLHLKLWRIICDLKFSIEDRSSMNYNVILNSKTPETKELLKKFSSFNATKLEFLSFHQALLLNKPITNYRRLLDEDE